MRSSQPMARRTACLVHHDLQAGASCREELASQADAQLPKVFRSVKFNGGIEVVGSQAQTAAA
jgi:hypothetical protein